MSGCFPQARHGARPQRARRSRLASRGPAILAACAALVFCAAAPWPAPAVEGGSELTDLSLEELLQVEVTTVSKLEEPLFRAPAAIYVVTSEEIRRQGATTIAESLRLAPGVEVARFDANKWAISIRGFNNLFANKLLVLMDGRSIYTPLFSGVFWDVQDTMIEDVDRIEVIRGPGGTLWGANAVNGVINIRTKSARRTQGLLATAGGGSEERAFGGVRYGGRYGDDLYYRVYAKYFDRADLDAPGAPGDAEDGWRQFRAGFRVDWDLTRDDAITFQGDVYDGRSGTRFLESSPVPPFETMRADDQEVGGGNLIARWQRTLSATARLSLQAYYDRTDRQTLLFHDTRDTFDLELQHDFRIGDRNTIVWGLAYRLTSDDLRGSFTTSLVPSSRDLHLFSGFVQGQRDLIENLLRLVVGTKLEHNDFTGWEVQPSARLLLMPDQRQTVWAAVSRAVRTPSRAEEDVRFNLVVPPSNGLPTLVSVLGSSTPAEDLLAYELGYRIQPLPRIALDVTAFYNDYDDLGSVRPGEPFIEEEPIRHQVQPFFVARSGSAESWGVELAADWYPTDWWHLGATYGHLDLDVDVAPPDQLFGAGDSPRNRAAFHSFLDPHPDVDLDTLVYYVDRLAESDVPSYVRLDVRVAWRPIEDLELSVVGQNLTEDDHREFSEVLGGSGAGTLLSSEVPRGAYGKMTWRF